MTLRFDILARAKKGKARAGLLHTPHGTIATPAFVGVGTIASVKGVPVSLLEEVGLQTIIANTYHLHLSPSSAVVKEAGGLHTFMRWQKPLLTDSGGFQVFSLGAAFGRTVSKVTREELDADTRTASVYDEDLASQHGRLAQIDEEGVTFTSHRDGSLHRFTPERSVEIQHELGADIFFAFDECTGAEADHTYQEEAMERTHRWAERSVRAHQQNLFAKKQQSIFGIVQGGRFRDLRERSAHVLAKMEVDGFGIGGSYQKQDLDTAVGWVTDILPPEKPRHLLGIGEPEDIVRGVEQGVDLFDCVQPTRMARTGTVYLPQGKVSLLRAEYVHDHAPLDPLCPCPVCRAGYTRAYLAHLFRTHEMLAPVLASVHNLSFLVRLVERERQHILEGR